jgi:hypothetical protein
MTLMLSSQQLLNKPGQIDPTANAPVNSMQLAQSSSVFDGRKMFQDTASAYRAGLAEIYGMTANRAGTIEHGFELIPGPGETIKLGSVVSGAYDGVDASRSDYHSGQDLRVRFGGTGKTSYPAGHSHPIQPGKDSRGLSIADINYLFKSRPLGGLHSIGLMDMQTGQGYVVTLDSRVKIPDKVMWCLGGNGAFPISESDATFTSNWFKEMVETGKLKVTLVNDLGNSNVPPAFKFQFDGANRSQLNYYVPANKIRRLPA